jgi:hypothetical protein
MANAASAVAITSEFNFSMTWKNPYEQAISTDGEYLGDDSISQLSSR